MGSTPMLLVTANVGSIFEDPSVMLKLWTEEFLSTVTRLDPKFVGVHCQEVGGKNYEQSMQHVEFFVKLLMSSEELRLFDKVRIFLDEDFSSAENFTALGNFYFIHKSITDILIWDFKDLNFVSVEGQSVYSGNIEHVPTKEKSKFPQDFFPECKWSRKGFLRTRWNLQGTVLDLVNIHLFHDASNFVAMETFPSVYSKTRQRALEYTLERFATDENGAAPFFLFGDFNFRTDTQGVIKKLGDGLDLHRIQNAKNMDSMTLEYRDDSNEVVMVLGKKEFSHLKHENIFLESPGVWLKEFDREIDVFAGRLFEFPISFPPSYPFEEDPCLASAAHSYMKTRCPAWCDRVVLGLTAKALVHDMSSENSTEYNLIGLDTCMGDHKPVYLKFNLKNHEGIVRITPSSSCSSPSSPPPPPALVNNKTAGVCRSCSVDIEDPSSVVPSSPPGVLNGVPRVDSPKSLKNIPVKQISFDDSMNLKGSKSSLSSVGLQFSIDPGLVDNNHTGSNASSRKSSIKSILIDKIKIVKRVNSESECACVSPQGQQASQSWRTRSVSLASSNISAAGNANNPQHVFVRSISKLKLRNDSLDTSHTSQISLPRLESHHSSSDEDWFEQVEEKITAIAGAGNEQDEKSRKISRTSRGSLEERESAGGFGSTSCFRISKTSSAAGDDAQSPPYRATASYVKPATVKTRPASSKLSNLMNVLKKQQRNSIIREEDVEKLAEKMGGSSRSEKLGSSKSEKLCSIKSEKLCSSRSEKLSGSTSLNDKDNNGTENEEREKLKIQEKTEEEEEEEEDMKEGDEEVGEELLEGKKRKKKKKKKKRKKKDGEQEDEEDRERRKYCIPCCRVS